MQAICFQRYCPKETTSLSFKLQVAKTTCSNYWKQLWTLLVLMLLAEQNILIKLNRYNCITKNRPCDIQRFSKFLNKPFSV